MSENQSSVAATTMASVLRDCLDSISGDEVPIVVFTPHEIYKGKMRDILGDVPKSRAVQFYIQDYSWRYRDSRVTVSDSILKCMVEESWAEWIGLDNMHTRVKTCIYKSPWAESVRSWNPQSVKKDTFVRQWAQENVSYVDMLGDQFDFPNSEWMCGNETWQTDKSALIVSLKRATTRINQKTLNAVGEEFTTICEEVKARKNKILLNKVNSKFYRKFNV